MGKHTISRRRWLGAAVGAVLGPTAVRAQQTPPPNIILILTDDQGWNGTSVQMDKRREDSRSDYYRTPNIERLARAGMRFSSGYAAAPICSPTRYSIQFGKTTARHGVTRVDPALGRKVNHDALSIPKALRKAHAGYAAAHIGKWHIEADPAHLGYEMNDGRTTNDEGGMSPTPKRWIPYTAGDPKRVTEITARANAWMARQAKAGKPFFLQLSHYATHADIVSRSDTLSKYEKLPKGKVHQIPGYAAMTENLDEAIGKLLDQVDALGVSDRTYIFFTADNGGVPVVPPRRSYERGQNHPLSRGKWDLTEGGIRVPFLVVGPGVAAGSQCDVPVVSQDLLPTFAELAGFGGRLPSDVDGVSFVPLLKQGGKSQLDRGGHPLVWHLPDRLGAGVGRPHSCIREDAWKLFHFWDNNELKLFDLAGDIGETNDVARQHQQVAGRLDASLTRYLESVNARRGEEGD
jgi:arylsulfatase A-like enzyme